MSLVIREMGLEEVGLIIDYFHGSTPEHLDLLGVDPTRLPAPQSWRRLPTAFTPGASGNREEWEPSAKGSTPGSLLGTAR